MKMLNILNKVDLNKESSSKNDLDCLICYDTHPISEIVSLECDDKFGRECMGEYLKSKIMEN